MSEMAVLPVSPDQVAVLWVQVLQNLETRIASEQALETWFRPIVPRELGAEVAELEVPNAFFVDWIHEHHLTALRNALTDVIGRCPDVRFVAREPSPLPAGPAARPATAPAR